jgi:putative peptidoglycan lipid II flippase
MIMPQAAIAQSIAIASLPTFSAQVAAGKLSEMRSSFVQTLRMIFFLTIPATIGLILLRDDLVKFLYQGGEFNDSSTELVSWALLWYAIGLVGHSIVEITSRAFYSLKDTRTPVTIGVVAMSLNLIFSIGLSKVFELNHLFPHGGLALANSLATAIESVILLLIMRERLDGLEGKRIFDGLWKASISSFCMMVILFFTQKFLPNTSTEKNLIINILVAVSSYTLILLVLKVEEIFILFKLIRQKLGLTRY